MLTLPARLRRLLRVEKPKADRLLIRASLVLYAASLTQDGFYISGPNPEAWSPGFALLLVGWLSLFDGVVAWLANPAVFSSWLLLRKQKHAAALAAALVALFLALSFLRHTELMVSEAPTYETVTGYGLGYGLWVAASAAALAATAMSWARKTKTPRAPQLDYR